MSDHRAPPFFTLASLATFLRVPDAGEELSPLLGAGCLVLDLDRSEAPLGEADAARLVALLPTLPCVVIARLAEASGDDDAEAAAAWASRCDVRVENDAQLTRLLSGFSNAPLAALCFVQLLRNAPLSPLPRAGDLRGHRGDPGPGWAGLFAGLVAESFVYSTLQSGPEFRRWKAAHKPSFLARRNRRSRTSEASPCRIVRNGETLEITLDRPEKHNAFSSAMRDALSEALNLALLDDSIREVVLKGAGRSFCSGGDLDEFGSFPDPTVAHATRTTRSPAFAMAQLAGRLRCEVQGACLGAGVELPSFSSRVVADEGAVFGLPELSLGLIPGAGGTVSLPRRIGRQRTAWLGLSGARIDARTALDWGLVDEVRLAHH